MSELKDVSKTALRVPAEWEARAGTLLAWPQEGQPWGGQYSAVVAFFRELIACLREQEPVRLLVAPDEREYVAALLGGEGQDLELIDYRSNDVWMRDAGPIAAWEEDEAGERRPVLLDANFNGWGGKFPHEMDRLIPTVLARRWGMARHRLPLTLEGGAIEFNGEGDLLTTEAVLLNPNRGNGGRDAQGRADVTAALQSSLGVSRVHWLADGLVGDDTDGHIDNLARFVSPTCIVCPMSDNADHPNHAVLADNRARLQDLSLSRGQAEVVTLPTPTVKDRRGGLMPASYANFYLAGEAVLVPVFGQPEDEQALGCLRSLFPDRQVRGLDARPVLAQGGAIHCLTQPLLA